MKKQFYTLLCLLFIANFAFAQILVQDGDLEGGQTYNWTKDNVYMLDGFVFLEAGGVLNIEPGTVIKGKETPSTSDNASALIIARDATINANGTAREPIIFTAEIDDTNVSDDLDDTDKGLWGGLIVLGNGVIGNTTAETGVEGIPAGEARALFGGNDDTDNSGVLRYISIRHGGAELAPGDEINGLTLGAVGSGTVIDHVEVFANSDDGIEFFGGAVSVTNASVAFCGDDSFDWDLGWQGTGQFWFSIQSEDDGDNGAEMDGAKPDDNARFSNPTVYNATYIGSGPGATAKNEHALLFRDGTAGKYRNSIFTSFKDKALQVEDLDSGLDSRQRFEDGDLALENNIWWSFGSNADLTSTLNGTDGRDIQWLADALFQTNNTVEDPEMTIGRLIGSNLDPRPSFGGAAYNNLAAYEAGFKDVDYKGAFGSTLWIRGWTALDEYGFTQEATQITIQDGDLEGGQTYTWTSDNEYLLDGFVFLEEGGKLNIEPGTVIKGKEDPSTSDNASALIISRGAQICAQGTENNPIIFTAEIDDTNVGDDLDDTDKGLWGGLIILGYGEIGNTTPETGIEGIPAGEPRALFGGNNDADNSGFLRYVSIRHGGAELAPGDEINGLTLGGVGSGTIIENVEVFANSDDGIEFFGGAVNVKNASVAFCGDDSYDWDLGWKGKGQFWFAIQAEDDGDNGAEMDGAKPDDNARFSQPEIRNATYIGSGPGASAKNEHALLFRDGTGGSYANSIFTSYKDKALQVEDLDSGLDSRQRFENGELSLDNNIWWEFGSNSSLISTLNGTDGKDVQWLADALVAANNSIENPGFTIDRFPNGVLNPTPGAVAYDNLAASVGGFFTNSAYKGAFCDDGVWIKGWTALSEYGYLDPSLDWVSNSCDLQAGSKIVIKDGDLEGGNTYNWTKDNVYCLDGFVFLEDGGTLNIEAGTVIKGLESPSTPDNASALIISRGAKIFANGTATEPIIFTAEIDDPAVSDDLDDTDKGLWGGLIVLGYGEIGNTTPETGIEGIPAGEARALFGGNDDADNSGEIRFVSIRHGGAELAPGDEINGLTLGGVGSGTVIENVEVFANSDDGIEFFGGAVSVKNASVAFCGDDSFDWDLGWKGSGQFWFSIQAEDDGDNGAEMDGAKPDDNARFSQPTIRNATYIGSGPGASAKNEHALLFRDGTGGSYTNSIFTSFKDKALQVEDLDSGLDSRQRFENGELFLDNNIWWSFGSNTDLISTLNGTDGKDVQWLADALVAADNTIEDPGFTIDRLPNGGLNPTPGAAAYSGVAAGVGGFFTNSAYKGAFCNDGVWIAGWTALSEYGYLDASLGYVDNNQCDLQAGQKIVIKDGDLEAGQTYNWTNNNTYCLDGFVFLEDGGTLNIEAGTVIKGLESPSTSDNASALIIARGAQIFANGTETSPIIFTAEIDDTNDAGDLDDTDKGLWGGLIVLGYGQIGNTTPETGIEGIPAGEARALFGGNDDADNSGELRFVSIRHGGAELAPGDEINGLTLGGVGSGTIIENVEVFANSDDGIEFFGGAVNVKGASVAFCGDDSFDWDLGWQGNGQFWFAIQSEDDGDNGAEMDGAKPDDNARFSAPNIRNATYIGSGPDASAKNEHALLFRDGTGGTYTNSIFTEYKDKGIQVEDLDSGLDSRQRLENGELVLANNIWWNIGNNTTVEDFINPTTAGADVSWLVSHLVDNGNTAEDPGIVPGDRLIGGGLNPTPGAAAYNDWKGLPSGTWFTVAPFKGAFCDDGAWVAGWTALSEYGYMESGLGYVPLTCDETTSTDEIFTEENGYILATSMPNPANDFTNINFSIPETANVSLFLFDASGRQLSTVLENERLTAGDYTETIQTAELPIGIYYYTLKSENVVLTKRFIVQR